MRIVSFKGGLGNQMFQYAFLLSFSHYRPDEEFLMDISSYYGGKLDHNGFELLRRFVLNAGIANTSMLKPFHSHINKNILYRIRLKTLGPSSQVFLEKDCSSYYPNVFLSKKIYYDGYWQCHKYFDSIRDEIKETFSFKSELDSYNLTLRDEILSNPNSVSLHIRRGDYLHSPLYKGICDINYYKKAINWICEHKPGENFIFYVFSNDIEWCKENLHKSFAGKKFVYISHNKGEDSYKDMQLMESCHYNVIANSSFSWWAAYLNLNSGSIVIAPRKWVNIEMDYKIQMDDWLLI